MDADKEQSNQINLIDIKSPADIKSLSDEKLTELAESIRKALLEKISKHLGHLGPNLGFVVVFN